jgi:hypothetical protein
VLSTPSTLLFLWEFVKDFLGWEQKPGRVNRSWQQPDSVGCSAFMPTSTPAYLCKNSEVAAIFPAPQERRALAEEKEGPERGGSGHRQQIQNKPRTEPGPWR